MELKLLIAIVFAFPSLISEAKLLFAINGGGESYTAADGIQYNEQFSADGEYFFDSFGSIHGVSKEDAYLYNGMRLVRQEVSAPSLGVNIPVDGNGHYVLIIKFCERWHNMVNRQFFDVVLNNKHTVLKRIDIFSKAGFQVAHDEYVYFSICNNRLQYKTEASLVNDNQIRVEFVKLPEGSNPYFNAISLFKNDLENVPKLPESVNAQFFDFKELQQHRCVSSENNETRD
jgi:hypothetical protein